jgi:glycosyltransferase involved in cell wall biosynthesis
MVSRVTTANTPDQQGGPDDEGSSEPRIHAIVVTYRRHDDVKETVAAVQGQTRPPDTWWIVDNDPSDELAEWAAGIPNATYHRSPGNLGPAGGIAAGMDLVLEVAADDDLIVSIDDDDPPPNDHTIEDIVALFGRDQTEGEIAGAGLVGAMYDRSRGLTRRLPDEELVGTVDVDYIGGNQLPTYRVRCVRDVGVFDRELFFGFDDLEFGLRLRAAGYRVVVDGDIMTEQRALAGRLGRGPRIPGSGLPPWRRYYSARNIVALAKRYGDRTAPAWAVAHGGPGAAVQAITRRDVRSAGAAMRGVIDGLRGRDGLVMTP